MRIALDTSGLEEKSLKKHKVRGAGEYVENLIKYLPIYDKENEYIVLNRGEKLPSDVDLIHYPYFEPFFLSAPLISKKPSVVTIHDLIPIVFPEHFPSGSKGGLKWQIQKYSLSFRKKIITDSFSSKKDIERFTGVSGAKINVVYLAPSEEFKKLEPGSWKSEIEEKFSLPKRFMLYVGDATWNKNLVRLAEAVRKTDIPLVMVGKALVDKNIDEKNIWNRELLSFRKEIEGDSRFLLLGYVTSNELNYLYNLASVLLMPSLYEGFGLPVLEAMSCGCPVITSKEGSLSEVAGDGAYFVEAQSIDSILEGIKKVLGDERMLEEMSKKGLENVKKFSWSKTIKETAQAYKEALND